MREVSLSLIDILQHVEEMLWKVDSREEMSMERKGGMVNIARMRLHDIFVDIFIE